MSSLLVVDSGIGVELYAMLGQGIVVAFRGSGVINFGYYAVAATPPTPSTNFRNRKFVSTLV